MSAQEFNLEVTPILPESLKQLEELANNLWYSWNMPARQLFQRLDRELWTRVKHNPKLFLRNVDQRSLHKAAEDPSYLQAYQQVLTSYYDYHNNKSRQDGGTQLAEDDLVAYFCAEYGFHESLPVYSGGLGILAGDHCKTASDICLPFVAIGLFYHQGYFTQRIDAEGNQIASLSNNEPEHLPVTPVLDESGNEILIEVKIGATQVLSRVWLARIGHISLYLLDTNLSQNNEDDRNITRQLYGGDEHTRIKQEIILGIGGTRLLRKLGLQPNIWHINEGHAAFLILERMRELIANGQSYETALEAVAANVVFTTHTPVPAGHDHFPQDLMMNYLGSFCEEELKLSKDTFLALGCLPNDHPNFNMTTLAIQGSRNMNGVSKIHGKISSEICAKFWPELAPNENPMSYVTNGVHVSSMLARGWIELFNDVLGGHWQNHLCDKNFWQRINNLPDQQFWSIKQKTKSRMLEVVRDMVIAQHLPHQISETHLERLLKYIDPNNPNILTIGFARRFATYKRANLLLNDIDRLRVILSDSDRPVLFIFAGKAHPADVPGQDLLRHIYRLSCEPDFIGKIIVMQGYDLALSRRLVSGVDVWLNNPVYPEEASGTSGMKVALNGGINLSVLDGWWPESYDGENGWAIKPSPNENDTGQRDRDDARTLYELLQDEVIPLYYEQGKYGYSEGWVKKSKRSMTTVLPQFNTTRMLNDYLDNLYLPAKKQGQRLSEDNYNKARELAEWKAHIRNHWNGVHIRQVTEPQDKLFTYGEVITIQVAVNLNNLQPQDLKVELLLSRQVYHPEIVVPTQHDLQSIWDERKDGMVYYDFVPEHYLDNGEHLYKLTFKPDLCGGLSYRIRVAPYHELLSHTHGMGMMRWL
ncbi:alpha-glucan family phosphorylase [Candidatus Halobeggiatoa sp. HSG11]|nr:alpha-glucan family phosphorylase [Candidatus Halobeggiatoa sp. HSG11]